MEGLNQSIAAHFRRASGEVLIEPLDEELVLVVSTDVEERTSLPGETIFGVNVTPTDKNKQRALTSVVASRSDDRSARLQSKKQRQRSKPPRINVIVREVTTGNSNSASRSDDKSACLQSMKQHQRSKPPRKNVVVRDAFNEKKNNKQERALAFNKKTTTYHFPL